MQGQYDEDCDDSLFEFDIGSPITSEDGDENMIFNQNTIVNLVEEYEDAVVETVMGRRKLPVCFDPSSDSLCSHKQDVGTSDREGFSNMFGSISSGLGSDRRSSHSDGLENRRLEGLSMEPEDWKENWYVPDDSSSGGGTTPILAVSPITNSPIMSPDSCLDEESMMEDETLCIECAARAAEEVRVEGDICAINYSDTDCSETCSSDVSFPELEDCILRVQKLDLNCESAETLQKQESDEEDKTESETDLIFPTNNINDELLSNESDASSNEVKESEVNSELQVNELSRDLVTPESNTNQDLETELSETVTDENLQIHESNNNLQTVEIEGIKSRSQITEEHCTPAVSSPLTKESTETSEDQKIEVSSTLRVSQDKLESLLGQLEPDKRYPNKANKELSPLRSGRASLATSTPTIWSELEDDEEEIVRPRLRKCISLKTGKTPPNTPGGRKIVRFADIFGLDLSEVKVFMDEVPRIPKSAYSDLNIDPSEYQVGSPLPVRKNSFATPGFLAPRASVSNSSTTTLVPMFNQPCLSPTFLDKVHSQKICLENAYMDGQNTVSGIVRVLNLDFHKAVTVRWTANEWNTVTEQQAQYVTGSSQGNTDKFSFRLECGSLPVGSRLQLCLKFSCLGEHWDSNGGANYFFQVFLNSKGSAGGGKDVFSRSQPLGISSSPRSQPSSRGRGFAAAHAHGYQLQASPSSHGDDPWLRFM